MKTKSGVATSAECNQLRTTDTNDLISFVLLLEMKLDQSRGSLKILLAVSVSFLNKLKTNEKYFNYTTFS